ncbi:hypothetical protein OHJ21_21215 [Virgibacillus sp. LDC1]|nr:hypothetical protein [Virgibacillus sp. LDC1]
MYSSVFYSSDTAQMSHRRYCSLCKPWLKQRPGTIPVRVVETHGVGGPGKLGWLSTEPMSGAILSLKER